MISIITIHGLPPPQTLPVSYGGKRETHVISDEAQGTMERRCRGREAVFSFLPSFTRPYLFHRSFPFPAPALF